MKLKERIGGQDGITFTAWAILFPWAIYFSLGYAPNRTPHSMYKWILTGILAHTVTGIPLLLGKVTLLRNHTKPRFYTTIFIFVIAGITRALSVGYFSVQLNASTKHSYIPRISASIYATPIWLAMSSLVVAGVKNHNRITNELVNKQEELARAKKSFVEQIDRYRAATRIRIQELVQSALGQAQEAADLSAGLIQASMEIIRPVSHQLARESIVLYPANREQSKRRNYSHWTLLLREISLGSAFPYKKILLIIFVSPIAALTATFGFIKAIPLALSLAITFFIIQFFAEKTTIGWRKYQHQSVAFLSVVLIWIVSAAGTGLLGKTIYRNIPALSSVGISYFTLTICLEIFASVYSASQILRANLEIEMQAAIASLTWETSRAQSIAQFEQQKIAQLVHGDIQSNLTATALKMKMQDNNSGESFADLKSKLTSIIEETPKETEIMEGLVSIKNVWNGVCEINLELKDIPTDPYASYAIISIAREAFSNSVRHGKATKIDFILSRRGNYWEVVAIDNGHLPKTIQSGGYGSDLMSKLAEKIELHSPGGRTNFRALIPAVK